MAKSKFTIKNITYEQYKEIKEEIETLKGHLLHLQQIKTILEAWEVVKNKGVDMLIFMLYYDNLEEYNNYIKSLEGECNYEKCLLTQNEADTIKKALEVEKDEYSKIYDKED